MTKADTKKQGLDIEEVLSLREELDELTSRIELAEQKKTAVKPEIYTKVKTDYESKMNKIINKLAKRSDALRSEFERTSRSEAKVKDKSAALQDELEEIKFRYALGEYSQEEHDRLSKEKMSVIKTMGKEKAALEESSRFLSDILSRIDGALGPREESAGVTAEGAVPDVEAEGAAPEVEAEVTIAPEPAISKVSKPETEVPHTQTPLDDIAGELEAEMKEPETEELASDQKVSLSGPEPEEIGPELVSESKEEKELKCPNCGFTNMPDSWYCEKCGAELVQESKGRGA